MSRGRLAAMLVVAALVGGACSDNSGDANSAGNSAAKSAQQEDGTPIITSKGDFRDAEIEIFSLKQTSSDVVTLNFSLHNTSGEELEFYDALESGYTVEDVYLLDEEGEKKYMVLRDSKDKCVCTQDLGKVKGGGRSRLFAKFPAPPKAVKSVDVVIPHFAPFDVTIER